MAYNGSGAFQIDSTGQPVVAGTTISDTVFNAFTADIATGLSTCITKDGQQTVTSDIPMATHKFTGMKIGSASGDSASVETCNVLNMCEGRLTLETGVPISTTDQTAKETLYFTPYRGNRIALFDGTNWVMRTFSELSIDVPDVTGVHDVFAYDNAGTVTLEVLVWTNDTTRATALTTQNGVLVKTGATTRRYLGTFYSTTAGNGQTVDSEGSRYLWNYYHRVPKPISAGGSNLTWNYTTATPRQADASSLNQFNCVVGVLEDPIYAELDLWVKNSSANVLVAVGLAVDATNSLGASSPPSRSGAAYTLVAGVTQPLSASYRGYLTVGKHYLSWNEYSAATGTTSWYWSHPSGIGPVGGISGVMWC
jgi:hypothetical protein